MVSPLFISFQREPPKLSENSSQRIIHEKASVGKYRFFLKVRYKCHCLGEDTRQLPCSAAHCIDRQIASF